MRQSDLGEGPGDAGVGEQNEGQKKTFSIGFGEGKEEQKEDVKPAPGSGEDQDRPTIGTPGPALRLPIALLEAPKCSIGQTPHRIEETLANIDRNEGGKNVSDFMSPNNLDGAKTST